VQQAPRAVSQRLAPGLAAQKAAEMAAPKAAEMAAPEAAETAAQKAEQAQGGLPIVMKNTATVSRVAPQHRYQRRR
jgi:hypothetical protein